MSWVLDKGVLVSWCILLSFWLLGKLLPPLKEFSRLLPSKEDFQFNKGFNKSSTVSRKQLAFLVLFGEAQVFTKFYVLMFLLIPGAIVLITRNAIAGKVEGALFLSDFDEENVETEQVILWLVVYCCCGCMFSKLLYFLQMKAVHEDKDFLFRKFPLQYSDKIFNQFAVIGSILLLFSSSSIRIKTADTENSEEKSINDLLIATTCLPVVLMYKFGYKGFYKVFNWIWFGAVPGVQISFLIAHWATATAVLFYISKTNYIAKYMLLSCFIMFIILPTLFWLLSFSRIEILPGTENRFSGKDRFYIDVGEEEEDSFTIYYSKATILSKPSRLGIKHWIWSPAKPQMLPLPGHTVRAPTELQNNSDFLAMHTTIGQQSTIQTLESFECLKTEISIKMFVCTWLVLCLIVGPFTVCVFIPLVMIQKCYELKGELMREIMKTEKKFSYVYVSPPLGRSVSQLVGKYEVSIYFVDAPGFQCAFAYLRNFLAKLATTNDENVKSRCWFIFQCDCYLDYAALLCGLHNVFNDVRINTLQEGTVTLYILYANAPTEVPTNRTDEFKVIEERSLLSFPHLGHINIAALTENEQFKTIVVISIGSSYMSNLSRQIVKNEDTLGDVEVLDIIFEESIKRMPTQMLIFCHAGP